MIDSLLNKGHRNPLCFDSVRDLEAYTGSQMEIDDVVSLLGVVSVGDGLGHQRIIKDTDDGTGILLTNGRYANIIPNSKLSDKANKAVQIVAGMGIKGGGTLGDSAINLSVESANEGLVVNSDSLELATVNNLKDSSTTKPLSAAMGQKLGDEKVNFTDIVNDFITGGTNKVASAETVKILKQIIDTMGEGGVAKLAAQLKSAEKSRIPSTGTLPAGGSVMVASSGLVIDPRVYVNGELVAPSGYTIDYNAATITLTEPVKYSAVFFIDDTYAPKFKFSVSTVNFLVNAPTLKEKLALGDVIDIQGESDAYDGGHHVRVVENTSKLNGVDLGGGLFLNEVPNSRISEIKVMSDINLEKAVNNRRDLLNIVGGLGANGGGREYTFIQDPGQKTAGKFYLDQNTMGIYKCVANTNSVNNDSSFEKIDLDATTTKLNNLSTYSKIEKGVTLKFTKRLGTVHVVIEGTTTQALPTGSGGYTFANIPPDFLPDTNNEISSKVSRNLSISWRLNSSSSINVYCVEPTTNNNVDIPSGLAIRSTGAYTSKLD